MIMTGWNALEFKIAGERRSMVVIATGPLQVAHAKTMDQQSNAPPRIRSGIVAPELHLERKRIGRIGKMVADHAVERRQSDRASSRHVFFGLATRDFPQRQVQPIPNQPHHAPDATIDQARDAAGHAWRHQAKAGRIQD